VPIDYDPLLAKLIGYGADRQQAIMRLQRALQEYFAAGIKTNISLFQRILQDPDFVTGIFDTGYLDRLLANGRARTPMEKPGHAIAAVAAALFATLDPASSNRNGSTGNEGPRDSHWKQRSRSETLH
jgi:acetyl-CoA carboxylase, biotin carboxylase subunit